MVEKLAAALAVPAVYRVAGQARRAAVRVVGRCRAADSVVGSDPFVLIKAYAVTEVNSRGGPRPSRTLPKQIRQEPSTP